MTTVAREGESPDDYFSAPRPPPPTTDFSDTATPVADGSPATLSSPTGRRAELPDDEAAAERSSPARTGSAKASPGPAPAGASAPTGANSGSSGRPSTTSLSPKAEAMRPTPLPSTGGAGNGQPQQPQQPVVSSRPASNPTSSPQPQQPVAAPGPPEIVQHVRLNFGPELGELLEREVYRRGWVGDTVEDLHTHLREASSQIFFTFAGVLGDMRLRAAVLAMLQGILQYHHNEQTPRILAMLDRNYGLDMLFNAMLNPVYLKELVEGLLQQQQRAAVVARQQAQQQAAAAQQAQQHPPQLQVGGMGPMAGVQYNRNGPSVAAYNDMAERGTPTGSPTAPYGDGSSRSSPQPQGGGPVGTQARRAPGTPQQQQAQAGRPSTSPTGSNPPAPRSQQQRLQQLQQQQQQQQQQQVVVGAEAHGAFMSGGDPAYGNAYQQQQQQQQHRPVDLHEQQHALTQAKAKLQQTLGGGQPQQPGATAGRPVPLDGGHLAPYHHQHQHQHQHGMQYPTSSFNSEHGGPSSGVAPPTPTSTTSSVPYSPLAAAFGAARNPPAAAPPAKAGPLSGSAGGAGPAVPPAGAAAAKRGPTITESLQSLIASGGRVGRVSMDGSGSAAVVARGTPGSATGHSASLSWADTEEHDATPAPRVADAELPGFLQQHGLGVLLDPLSRNTSLAELRQMGAAEFEASTRRWIASTAKRQQLSTALHPSGHFPPERRAWLKQQQQQQQSQQQGPQAPGSAPSTPPQMSVGQPQAGAPAAGSGGIPAPRSSAKGAVAAPSSVGTGKALPPPPQQQQQQQAAQAQHGQVAGADSESAVAYLRLRLVPFVPDEPQPTDATFQREALRQLPVRNAQWLGITWTAAKGAQCPSLTFSVPKPASETLRHWQVGEMTVGNVRYRVERCTVGPNLPKTVDVPPAGGHAAPAGRLAANTSFGSQPGTSVAPSSGGPAAASSGKQQSSYAGTSNGANGRTPGHTPPQTGATPPPVKSPKIRAALPPHGAPPPASSMPVPPRSQQQQQQHQQQHKVGTPEQAPARPAGGGAAQQQRPPPAAATDPLACRFYGLPTNGCRRGADCQYRHDEQVAALNRSNAQRIHGGGAGGHGHHDGGRGGSAGPSSHAAAAGAAAPSHESAPRAGRPAPRHHADPQQTPAEATTDTTPARSGRRSRGGQ